MATLSERTTTPSIEANLRVKNDHELFLEAYEKPTQIYRFLKAKHSLEPIFLHRNLTYMKHRNSLKNKRSRRKIKLDEMTRFTNKDSNIDLSTQIKSDNHLQISFHSLSKGLDVAREGDRDKGERPEGEGNIRQGTLMQVEVLLYRFKHPTAEALLTSTPQSLNFVCTSLGKCVVPYSSNGDVSDYRETSSLTIPGSVLSWKGTNGVLGTHMLAFRVTPCTADVEVEKSIPEIKRISRKRKAHSDVGTKHVNNILVPPNRHNGSLIDKSAEDSIHTHISTTPNGLINKAETIKSLSKADFLADANELCNGHWEGDGLKVLNMSSMSRLQRKAPGGKKLPTSGGEETDELIVSFSRSLLAQDIGQKSKIKKRNELQLLIDGDKPKPDWIPQERIPNLVSEDLTSRSTRSADDDAIVSPNARKRILTDFSTEISQNGFSANTIDTACNPPPHKKPCITSDTEPPKNHVKPVSSPFSSSPSATAPEQQDMSVYCAELVAFDSRQECLLLDGKYEILMQKCSQDSKKNVEASKRNVKSLSSLEWDSVFSKHTESENNSVDMQSLTLNLTAKWFTDPPKSRPRDVINTAFDFVQLRKEYDSIISKDVPKAKSQPDPSSRETSSSTETSSSLSSSVEASLSSLKPIVFNFLYNKNTLQQTELKDNCVCPWCSLDCKYLYSLLKHLSLCHPRFQFTYSPADRGVATIDVRINRTYYSKQPSADPVERMGANSVNIKRRPTKCKSSTSLVVDKCEECINDLSEFTAGKQSARPKLSRIFYHTQSCLPMMPNERDSEEESVTEWLKTTSLKMVDEFIDVNYGEKQFMKVWNLYMMEKKILADKQMPQACLSFAKDKKEELKEKSILYNLITHVIYMCDIGLVPPYTLTEVIRVIRSDIP